MNMNPSVSTIERGNINVLVWPVFGGLMAWASLISGINLRFQGENEDEIRERAEKGLKMVWDYLDQHHEDNAECLSNFMVCRRYQELSWKLIPVPAAPPYLEGGVLDRCIEQAYS